MPSEPSNSPQQPLVFRSYRRHRKQSRWGTYSLFPPVAALLWVVFWYLMMNRTRMPGSEPAGFSSDFVALLIGAATFSAIGTALATLGMLDGYYKHGRAAVGLTINLVFLVGAAITFFLRVFVQGVGGEIVGYNLGMTAIQSMPALLMKRHRVTVREFERMIDAGVFHPESRIELFNGEIIQMSPIGSTHMGTVNCLTSHFTVGLGPLAVVSVQGAFRLDNVSRPQPDVLVLKPREDFYRGKVPVAADVLLAVEVSDSTFRYDYGVKRPRYARNGVRETWIVDTNDKCVYVCRQPRQGKYVKEAVASGADEIAPQAFPGLKISVKRLLG